MIGRHTAIVLAGMFVLAASAVAQSEDPSTGRNAWEACFNRPADWYGSAEAIRIADNVLLLQRNNGGWPKNIEIVAPFSDAERDSLREVKDRPGSTIDNGATHSELQFLRRVWAQTGLPRFKDGLTRGLEYLLAAQYPNGGWPQFFPVRADYSSHITFNDDAMTGVLDLFLDLVRLPEDSSGIDAAMRARLQRAIDRGVDCVLRCQIRVDGERTVWCAQHDEHTLAPAAARTYELPSFSGKESVEIVRFLMRFEHPQPETIAAIQGAIRWFDGSRIRGIRVVEVPDPTSPSGMNKVIVTDSTAPPLWGRFYDLETQRVFYCSRDGIKRFALSEISTERRNHYGWLGDWPAALLSKEYPRWQRRWVPSQNLLGGGGRSR